MRLRPAIRLKTGSASQDAARPPAAQLQPEANVGHPVDERNANQSVAHASSKQNLKSVMADISFKDSYRLSSTESLDGKNPPDSEELNPLALHNANLDDEYALKEWLKMPVSDKASSDKKSFQLKKLLENHSIDFKKLDNEQRDQTLKESIKLGDLDNFKKVLDNIEQTQLIYMREILAEDASKLLVLESWKL